MEEYKIEEINQLKSKIKFNTLLQTISIIFSILFFGLFLYFAYGLKIDGEHTPICFILSIIFVITFFIIKKYKKTIEEKLNNVKQEYNYYLHCERMKIENAKFEQYKTKNQIIEETQKSKYHIKTITITDNEKYFLDIIKKHFSKDYDIRFQVPLSSVIEKEKEFDGEYQNELNRIIDIGIFDKNSSCPLLLIEINDSTHKRKDRQIRDAKVKDICNQAGIILISFWTEYSNTEQYIVNRINANLIDSN